MPHINLLPWREDLRKRRQKEFGVIALVTMLLMGGVVLGVHLFFQQQIDHQERRNDFLDQQIAALDKKIEEIQDLEREKERLLARMDIIQKLQSSRPEVVHVMDTIVNTLPEGVFYTEVAQKGTRFSLKGTAQSNARVSSLMRSLEESEWFENPNLVEIKANSQKITESTSIKLSDFVLNITQSQKKKPEPEEGGGKS